ncbi:MAG: DciA family protein [Candidatus Competibacterales bacterium]
MKPKADPPAPGSSREERNRRQRGREAAAQLLAVLGRERVNTPFPPTRPTAQPPPRPPDPLQTPLDPPPDNLPKPFRRRPPPWRTVQQTLGRGRGQLTHLLAQVDEINRLNAVFHDHLPLHFQDHANLIPHGPQGWTIYVDSPAWATRIRYLLPNLRRQLKARLGVEVPRLQVRVRPVTGPPKGAPLRYRVGRRGIAAIEQAAQRTHDPLLRRALQRLARRVEGRSKDAITQDAG